MQTTGFGPLSKSDDGSISITKSFNLGCVCSMTMGFSIIGSTFLTDVSAAFTATDGAATIPANTFKKLLLFILIVFKNRLGVETPAWKI